MTLGKKGILLKPILLLIAAVLGLVFTGGWYLHAVQTTLAQETKGYLSEVAQQGARLVSKQIESDLETLEGISAVMGSEKTFDIQEQVSRLNRQKFSRRFLRMGIISVSGIAYTTDGETMDFSDREYYQRAMAGFSTVSDRLIDRIGGGVINVYAVPIYHYSGQLPVGVLFATFDTGFLVDTLDVSTFDGEGYSYIIDADGEIVIETHHPKGIEGAKNLFDIVEKDDGFSKQEEDAIRENLKKKQDGGFSYQYEGEKRYLNYTPIGINDWFVLSVVSADVITKRSLQMSLLTLFACFVVAAAFLGLLIYNMRREKKNREKLRQLAYKDRLTGGRNWNKFLLDAQEILASSSEYHYAMIIFDVDKFKVFNDLFGHDAGNEMLCFIWGILKDWAQEGEVFARVSSDNFGALIRYTEPHQLEQRLHTLADQICGASGGNHQYEIILSFGVYLIHDKTLDVSRIRDRATIAKRRIKGSHENKISYYDEQLRSEIIREKAIEDQMEAALENQEFQVYFQPKVFLSTKKIAGAEALIRWEHPQKGLLLPGDFLPVFEKNEFVIRLDNYVLDQVCQRISRWLEQGYTPIPVAVNISRVNLHDSQFVAKVKETAARWKVPPKLIELELTESAAQEFKDTQQLAQMMEELQQDGFRIAMDDFGTGYSSLNLLKDLPVDVLKLDREFFAAQPQTSRSQTVIRDVILMAKHLHIMVVAEGVETKEQLDLLDGTGCDIVQGFYFAQPMSAEEFERQIF